jgi:hypothetical protein
MATWVDPIDSQTDPDAPLTSEIGKRWDNNPIAIAEGAAGAPRVSPAAWGHSVGVVSAVSGVAVLSGFSTYGGAVLEIKFRNSVASFGGIVISLSDDGVSFGSSTLVASVGSSTFGSASVMVDFSSGVVRSVYSDGGSAGHISSSVGVPTGDVSHIKVSLTGSATISMGVLSFANAGDVA